MNRKLLRGGIAALFTALLIPPLFAWGVKGHMISGRVAARALPEDTPPFFRLAVDRLAYLIPEPDRWRGEPWGGHKGVRQELTNATSSNHNVRLELLQGIPYPVTRNEFVALAVEKGIVPRDEANMHKLGTVFYAIVEDTQRLVVEFRLWREAQEAAAVDAAAVQQIQENAIFCAGVLGHWITDAAQPLHTTVHSDDWDPHYPNPKGYQSRGIHGRFETVFVDQHINDKDVVGRVAAVRLLGDWRAETEAHLRRSFSHFEEVYALDQRGTFGSGKEPEEAKAFTAARLGEGASMLRDVWYSAWIRSEEELWDSPVRLTGVAGRTALDLLREARRVEMQEGQVTAIGQRRNGRDGRRWSYTINGAPGKDAPGNAATKDGDVILWRFGR